MKSLVPFQREVYQAIGYFPVINMIVNVCIITIAINKTITLPADNCDRYLIFITTTAHRHLVLDKKFIEIDYETGIYIDQQNISSYQ